MLALHSTPLRRDRPTSALSPPSMGLSPGASIIAATNVKDAPEPMAHAQVCSAIVAANLGWLLLQRRRCAHEAIDPLPRLFERPRVIGMALRASAGRPQSRSNSVVMDRSRFNCLRNSTGNVMGGVPTPAHGRWIGSTNFRTSVLHRTVDSHHVATSRASPVAWCNLEIQGLPDLAAPMVRSRSSTLTTFDSRGEYQASDSEH